MWLLLLVQREYKDVYRHTKGYFPRKRISSGFIRTSVTITQEHRLNKICTMKSFKLALIRDFKLLKHFARACYIFGHLDTSF